MENDKRAGIFAVGKMERNGIWDNDKEQQKPASLRVSDELELCSGNIYLYIYISFIDL